MVINNRLFITRKRDFPPIKKDPFLGTSWSLGGVRGSLMKVEVKFIRDSVEVQGTWLWLGNGSRVAT